MAQNVIEKIVQAHAVGLKPGHEVRAGDYVTIVPDHVMTHDNSSAVLGKFKGLGITSIHDPRQPVFTLDHNIQDLGEANQAKYRTLAEFAATHGIDAYPAGRGIGHQVMIEEGYARPGGLCVASDSHSNTYGGVGALGTPVVRTDAAALWATGTVWWQVPPAVRVTLEGRLRPGVTGKDTIITLCGLYNQGEVLNTVIEFTGPGVATLPIEERLTIANMTTEWGALAGWFPVDEVTLAYMESRRAWLESRGIVDRVTADDIARWRSDPPRPDDGAAYAGEIRLDLSQVTPHLSGPDTVQVMASLATLAPQRIRVDKAYLLSCTNARLADLEAAADVLRGKKVAPHVKLYVSAASELVEAEAHVTGVWQTLLEAGAIPLPSGCGPCIGLGTGLLEDGEVGISATNRNFKGRMGSRNAKAYLASPAVVAASALAGHIAGPEGWAAADGAPSYDFRTPDGTGGEGPRVEVLAGFPALIEGRLLYLPADNLNTDGIYGKDYTYREDMSPAQMAAVVMENYDPQFAGLVRAGDVVCAGFNFGTGSSREQAATALMAAGIRLVIAGSYSQTYLRNAINNGFLCVECPDFARALHAHHAGGGGRRTIIDDEPVRLDVAASTIRWRGQSFRFLPLGTPVQRIVLAGGVENMVRTGPDEPAVNGTASLSAVVLWTALWCLWHSLLATHRWRALVQRLFPRWHAFSRLVYVLGSTATLVVLLAWLRTRPERLLWAWSGPWALARALGLVEAAFLFWAGARAYDNRHFLGLAQMRDYAAGRQPAEPPFRAEGILAVIRHPWYSATLLLLVFMLPWTDVNLAWRGTFLAYTLLGCELEERKLLRDVGTPYAEYRRRVGRYWPRRRRARLE